MVTIDPWKTKNGGQLRLSVLRALFDALDIEDMQVAQGALRQGVLYDMVNRESPATDLRSAAVTALSHRFGVDGPQAQRVAEVATRLFAQVAPAQDGPAQQLGWAAQLHEVGCRIAHSGYHRHGAYILEHTDAAGFAQGELQSLAQLVRAHRGKLRKLELDWSNTAFVLQLACLRLAVALCHARCSPDLAGLSLQHKGERLQLCTRGGWADAYPQSVHLLREESADWQRTPWTLSVEP